MPEYSDYVETRIAAPTIDGTELMAGSKDGQSRQWTTQQVADLAGVTREFNRTFVEALVFNKNEIFHAPTILTGDLNLTIGSGGLVDEASFMRFRFITDGTHAIFFGTGFDFLYPPGLVSGAIPAAGTYEMYLLYTNGSVVVNLPGASSQSSSGITLATPSNFAGVADGQTEVDLTWDDVENESSYLIEVSTTGVGAWATLLSPAANATSGSQTGLSAGDLRFYRMRSIGDGVNFISSAWTSVISVQTQDAGDVADPTFTFLPASGNTTMPVNRPIVITANEPIRNTDETEITNANVAALLTLKETNSGGANIPFTATIDGTKTIITITPTTQYGENQLVYVAINNVEDVNGNDVTVAVSSTFTTTDFAEFNGTSNRLIFGDILDSLFAVADSNFWLELTITNFPLVGTRNLIGKLSLSDNQRSFGSYYSGTDVFFAMHFSGIANVDRLIKWTNVLTAGEHILVFKIDQAIDTNNGLDRLTLLIDGVPQGSKTLASANGALGTINNSTAQLSVSMVVNNAGVPVSSNFYAGEAKDFIIRSTGGTVVEINVPNLRTGLDISGNARHGTWV